MSLADDVPGHHQAERSRSRRTRTSRSAGRPSSSSSRAPWTNSRPCSTACQKQKVPVRMLGGGYNLLVRDDPVPGAVVRLTAPAFTFIEWDGKRITAGGGGPLFDLIAFSVRHGLGGLETLVGIRGTVGGSVRCNVGDRSGEIGQAVRQVTVLTDAGKVQVRSRDELTFSEHQSDLDEPVILSVEFELEQDAAGSGAEADAEGVDSCGRRPSR